MNKKNISLISLFILSIFLFYKYLNQPSATEEKIEIADPVVETKSPEQFIKPTPHNKEPSRISLEDQKLKAENLLLKEIKTLSLKIREEAIKCNADLSAFSEEGRLIDDRGEVLTLNFSEQEKYAMLLRFALDRSVIVKYMDRLRRYFGLKEKIKKDIFFDHISSAKICREKLPSDIIYLIKKARKGEVWKKEDSSIFVGDSLREIYDSLELDYLSDNILFTTDLIRLLGKIVGKDKTFFDDLGLYTQRAIDIELELIHTKKNGDEYINDPLELFNRFDKDMKNLANDLRRFIKNNFRDTQRFQ